MTDRQFIAWYQARPDQQTCRECGKTDSKIYVSPQLDGGALCCDCRNALIYRQRAERRAYLASLPRCEVPGCNHRGAMRVGGSEKILVCKHCGDKAIAYHRAHHSSPIWFATAQDWDRDTLLAWAQGKEPTK